MRAIFAKWAVLGCAVLGLVSCGGGDSSNADEPSKSSERLSATSVVPITANDTILLVSLSWFSAGNTISITNGKGAAVTLYKDDGKSKVTSLDDLPEGLAHHAWTKSSTTTGHLRLQFAPGTYRFKTGWKWPAAASGHSPNSQIVVEKKPGSAGDVLLMGSEAFSATYRASRGKVAVVTTNQPFEQLWAEDGRAIRARTPNAGSFFYVRGVAHGWPASDGSNTVVDSLNGAPMPNQAFQADPEAYKVMSAIKAANDTQAVLMMTDSWQVTKHRVAEVDSIGQRVRVSPPSFLGFGLNGHGQRYFVENTASALDAPGEWYFSASGTKGTLSYIPVTTKDGGTVNFEVPRVSKLLLMQGNVDGGQWLQYVQFSGLKFRYAKADMPSSGYVGNQSDSVVAAAIELNDARLIEFVNCEVSHTGGYGMWLNNRVRDVRVTSSEIYDLGAGGIKVGKSVDPILTNQDWLDVKDPNTTGRNVVEDSRIHSLGHVYPGSVGIWVGRSSDNVIQNNLIKDTTYTGISVGWNWGTGPSMASNNKVLYNFLVNIGQRSLADLGGIYLLGRAPGTVVQGNVVKEVRSFDGYAYGGNGIYGDEGSSEVKVTGNVVLGVDGSGFSLHYGEQNWVSGNALANVARVFCISRRAKFSGVISSVVPLTMDANRFFPSSNEMVGLSDDEALMVIGDDRRAAATKGQPCLPQPNNGTAAPSWVATAPVVTNNKVSSQFIPANMTLAIPTSVCTGCVQDTALSIKDPGLLAVPAVSGMSLVEGVNVARSWTGVPLSGAVSAARLWAGNVLDIPAKVVDFRASQWPLGKTSLPGWLVLADSGTKVDPSDATVPLSFQRDADGTQFLALADTARKNFQWEPYIENWLGYDSGTAIVSFKARFDANTDFTHEWRSDNTGATVGPQVRFRARGDLIEVIVNGQALPTASIRAGEWVTVEVASSISVDPSWSLKITTSTKQSLTSGLKPASPDWHFLGPVLFISGANTQTTTALADIQISRH
jgi:parallel beta-helix repeat protein